MKLTGDQFRQLSDALASAFNLSELRRMLRTQLDMNLENIASAGPLPDVVDAVIGKAERFGWVVDLIGAAKEENPGNPALRAFTPQFDLGSTTPPAGPDLERIVRRSVKFVDVAAWCARMGEIVRQLCRLEVPTPDGPAHGTGFLLGPDLVLTNCHVIESLLPGRSGKKVVPAPCSHRDAVLRFDYTDEQAGTDVRLADDWLVDHSPPSPVDDQPEPKTEVPKPDQLDYALLRVKGKPGNQRLDDTGRPRRWLGVSAQAGALRAGAPLLILQHPEGTPLKLAIDTEAVLGLNGNGTRVKYRTNTEPGSSGSPCFTLDWELVALHHAGDPNFDPPHKPQYNEGIPLEKILALLEKRGLGRVLGGPPGRAAAPKPPTAGGKARRKARE